MLNLDASQQIDGLTVFRDFNDPSQFYYLPNAPRLARDASGEPLFQLLIYRRDITDNPAFREGQARGGGFLTMTVDLKVSDGTLDAVKSKLKRQARVNAVKLVPVPVERGSVRVTTLGVSAGNAGEALGGAPDENATAAPSFVENVLGSATPSMYGDNRAVFSIELSSEGALLMKASLEDNGASSIAVVYELEYKGLMPARECTIEIDYRQTYSHLRQRAQLNTLWFKSDVDREMERMRQQGAIRIEDVDYMGGLEPEDARRRETELHAFARELAQWTFFKPSLRPGDVLAKERGTVSVYSPDADATANTAGFTTPLRLALTGAGRSSEGQQVLSGRSDQTRGIGGAPTGTDADSGGSGSGDAGSGGSGSGGSGSGGSGSGSSGSGGSGNVRERPMTAVERWNAAGRPQAGYTMRSLNQDEEQTITYNMRRVAAVTRTIAPQGSIKLSAGDADLGSRITFVDLADPFFQNIAGTVTTSATLDEIGVDSMVVKLRYGHRADGSFPAETQEFILTEKDQVGAYRFPMGARKSVELEYQVEVNYTTDFAIGDPSTKLTTPWMRTSTRNLDIDPRSVRGLIPVRLVRGMIDWSIVKAVQVSVIYADADHDISAERQVQLDEDSPETLVPIRPADDEARAYTVNAVWFYEGSSETVEIEKARGDDVVLNQPPSKAVPIMVSMVDPLDRFSKVTVEMKYQPEGALEQRSRVFSLTADAPSASWTFFRASLAATSQYACKITKIGKNGTVQQQDWTHSLERQLIVGDIFPGKWEIEAELIDDPRDFGFRMARLTIEYPDAPEGIDSSEHVMFREGPGVALVTIPSATAELGPYTWKLEFFGAGGQRKTLSGESQDESLLLFAPLD